MKSIVSAILTAVMLLSVLAACGTTTRSNMDTAGVTANPAATADPNGVVATPRPSATTDPNGMGDAVGNAARDAGNAVGNAVEGVGNAVGNAAKDAGDAVNDMFDRNGSARSGAGMDDTQTTTTPRP